MSNIAHPASDIKDAKADAHNLAWALRYAQSGIPVFPLIGKQPAIPGGGGYTSATTDEAQIRKWWSRYPSANIGIPTGNASGFWVLDVDGEEGQESFSALQDEFDFLHTPVINQTGRGHHLLFKMNGRDIRNRAGVRPGIDVRGNGGYIVAPPSIHPAGGTYAWVDKDPTTASMPYAPDWVCDLVEKRVSVKDEQPAQPSAHPEILADYNHDHPYVRAAVDREVRAVASAGKGTRNDALNRAAYSLGQFVGAKVLSQGEVEHLLISAATASGLVSDDGEIAARKTIASGLTDGIANPRKMPEARSPSDSAKLNYAAKQNRQSSTTSEVPPTGPSGNGAGPSANDPAIIQIVAGDLPRIVTEAEMALLSANAPVFQRGSMLVSVGRTVIRTRNEEIYGPRILPMTAPALVEQMTKAAMFQKWDGRQGAWTPTDCPTKVAETYLARPAWGVRALAGIIEAPTLRWDGSILDQPGYDAATGLMLIGKVEMPAMAAHPTKADAQQALTILKEPISAFPFATEADRSVALSGMLTAICRRAFKSAPLHAFTAPVAGSGKGKLVDIISIIATGRPAPVIAPGKNEEEAEKRLGSALINGDPLISIDNLEQPLGGELLCQSLTQPVLKIRILGQSLNVEVPSIAAMFATGNNIAIQGDMTRRTMVCTIDPGVERPELREFDFDPIAMVGADRGRYIAAALTVLRAYVLAGFPDRLKPLGSFEDWSNHVRSSLVWLGEADPIATMDKARESDPVLAAMRAVMSAWSEAIGHLTAVTAATLVKEANKQTGSAFGVFNYENEELREALMGIAGVGGTISTRSLGRWLKSNAGRVVNGMRIIIANADAHNGSKYLLEKIRDNRDSVISGAPHVF